MEPTAVTVLSRNTMLMELAYVATAFLFILGLKMLSSPATARKGIRLAEIGMLTAVLGTLLHEHVVTYEWIILGLFIGSVAGGIIAIWTPMTAMPQRTALSHAFGAIAVSLVGIAEFYSHQGHLDVAKMTAIGFEVMLGGLTFTGSMMAFAKLQGTLPGRPITYPGQNAANIGILAGIIISVVYLIAVPTAPVWLFYAMVAMSFIFGILLVLPIGAADMPVVIALLNSYAGLAGSATGFALDNKILIVAGALDGASGLILSILMCKAMNRSITNVIFGGFGKAPEASADASKVAGSIRSLSSDEASVLITGATRVVVVPGYGMAVSQAQMVVKELADLLGEKDIDVQFAIHPVAGRMPGHMNVLLAEAGVPYDRLKEMDAINPEFKFVDVAIVVGANDVVNPAAKNDKSSPIYGMPVLDVESARSVLVLKRSMAPGFAGIENELFYKPNCMMVFGDARKTLQEFVNAAKASAKAA
ncbi:MAG: NAD(P)(+) transhydrogenase (Re/Si-specific) subunit beta [Deltaproteobacteria bacterium]|nr:NAD(P)(+) transhydrogenase (Re/Si-specific) subunit beta [Deltaproteobacteria bacterium]